MERSQIMFDILSDDGPLPAIGGLHYFPSFLDGQQQSSIIEHIDSEPWLTDLERRVQHYGWRYDYRARTINRDMQIGPLPKWLGEVASMLYEQTKIFDTIPNQAIVNEYTPGQGIAMHVDRDCFGSTVATVSLGDDWIMDLQPVRNNAGKVPILLERGSALVLTGEARYRWMHGIAKRKSDVDSYGRRHSRRRRLSLTFRTVHLDNWM